MIESTNRFGGIELPSGNALEFSPEMVGVLETEARAYRDADPTLLEQLGAAYGRVSSLAPFQAPDRPDFEVDPSFDPGAFLTPGEIERHGRVFMAARSREELDWLRSERQRIDRLDQIMGGGPLHPLLAGAIASVFDPINLLPIGWVATPFRGATIGRVLVQGATIGAAGNLAVEPFLRNADPFRDINDTALDLVIGGVFGAGLAGAISLPSLRRADQELTRQDIEARQANSARIDQEEAARLGVPVERIVEARQQAADAVAEAQGPRLPAEGGSVGAARLYPEAMDDLLREKALDMVGPKFLQTVGRGLGSNFVTRMPGYTLITSRFTASRKIVAELADVGVNLRTSARDMSDKELGEVFEEGMRRGLLDGYAKEDFIAAARERMATGLAQAKHAPLFSRIHFKTAGRLKGFMDEYVAAEQEARALGFQGSREDLSNAIGRYAQYLQEPDRFSANPIEGTNLAPAFDRAIKAWQERIARPALRDIKAAGIWRDTIGGAAPNPNFVPKMFNREKVLANLPAFTQRWVEQLTEAVEAARQKVNAYQQALRAYQTRQEQGNKFLSAVTATGAAKFDPGVKDLVAALRSEARAARKVDEVETAIRKDLGTTSFEFLTRVEGMRANNEPLGAVDEAYYTDLIAALANRDRAGQVYEALRKRHGPRAEALSSVAPPTSRGPRPEKPPGYDEANVLVSDPERGLPSEAAIRAEAARIVDAVAFGADANLVAELGLRGSLKGRTLDMDPDRFGDFMETSFARIAEQYNSMTARDVETFRTFGTVDAAEIAGRITKEAAAAQEKALAAGDAKAVEAIKAEALRDVQLVQDLVAKARGQSGIARTAEGQTVQAALRTGMSLSFMARMGSGLLAQIGDLTTFIARYGGTRVFGAQLQRFALGMGQASAGLDRRAKELFSTALDGALNDQQRLIFDVAPAASARLGAVGRAVDWMTPRFSKLTLMPWWNDQMRMTGVLLTENLALEAAQAAKAGKAIAPEAGDMFSRAGFNRDLVMRLAERFEKSGTMNGSLRDSNIENWISQDPELADAYRLLIHVGAQRALITPSGVDRPMWTQKALGQAVMQFKGFVMASLPQLLVPFLQSPAGKKLEIMVAALAVGALSTTLRDINTRGEVKDRTAGGWVIDSLDMSGLTSFLTEADATLGRINPHLSAKRLLTGEELSRFQNRTDLGAFLGPLAGMAGSAAEFVKGASTAPFSSTEEFSAAHLRAGRTIMPFQNHFLLRHGLDVMEAAVHEDAKARGLVAPYLFPDRPTPEPR